MSSLKEMLVSPQTPVNPFSMQDSILGGRRLVDSQDSLVTNALQQLNDARGDTNTSGLGLCSVFGHDVGLILKVEVFIFQTSANG